MEIIGMPLWQHLLWIGTWVPIPLALILMRRWKKQGKVFYDRMSKEDNDQK